MTRPGMWSHYDDGIVSGRLHRALYPCDVCGQATACVWVDGYNFPNEVPWTATIIAYPKPHSVQGIMQVMDIAVFIGLGCGCLAKFHRQVAYIKDSVSRDREAMYGGTQ